MAKLLKKKLNLQLVGLDGNAFALLGAFKRQAKQERWTEEEIKTVLDEATSKDYNHLLSTLIDHTVNPVEKDNPNDLQ